MFTTVEEVFDGFDALPFERQCKRMLAIMPDNILMRAVGNSEQGMAWFVKHKVAIITASNDGTLARLRAEIAAENKENKDVPTV